MKVDHMTLADILRQQRMARKEVETMRRIFGPDAVKMAVLTRPGMPDYKEKRND